MLLQKRIMRYRILALSLFLFFSLFLVYSLIPIYEKEDDSFKSMLAGGNKYWHDGISPLLFAYFKNYLESRNFTLPNNTVVDEYYKINVSEYVDVICIRNLCHPLFYSFGLHMFFEFSFRLNKIFQINPLQYLQTTNIVIYALSAVILFLILNKINKKKIRLNFILSLLVGLGTSFIIYSKYLFLHNSFQAFTFLLFLYSSLLFDERKTKLRFLFWVLSSVSFVIFWQVLPAIIVAAFLILWFQIFNYKRVGKFAFFSYILPLVLLISLNCFSLLSETGKPFIDEEGFFSVVYKLYKNQTFRAVDFTPGPFSYSIANDFGNAVFLKFYSIFGYFFGPKGIFVNSPFLFISFLGMMAFTKRKLKLKLILLLVFLIFLLAYITPQYEGGFSPRYVRHAEPIIAILTIFLADYLGRKKENLIFFIFTLLALISMTNCVSLAIRSDWNYEKITDLVSYDIAIWPWLPIKQEGITLDLTKFSEQARWNLSWEEGCNPPYTPPKNTALGIELGPCACSYLNSVQRKIIIPEGLEILKLSACSTSSGLDGIMVYLKIDEKVFPLIFDSNSCKSYYLNISNYSDNKTHNIKISADSYGTCNDEFIYLKKMEFLRRNESLNIISGEEAYNLIGERRNWILNGENKCFPSFLSDSLFLDKCLCVYTSNATRILDAIKHEANLSACSRTAGNDGTLLKIFTDGKSLLTKLIKPESCENLNFFVPEGFHNITFSIERYGNCNDEGILIKSLYVH
jgi:hypothetical protein